MKGLSAFLIIIFFAGCATVPPVMRDIQTQKTYDAAHDEVWDPLVNFFNNKNIPIKAVDKVAGIISSQEIRVPYDGFLYKSEYCDCGMLGGLYVYHDIIGTVDISLREGARGKISVSVNANYRASLWSGRKFTGWVSCQSKGYFEKSIFKYLDSILKIQKKENEKKPE